MDKRYQVFVSSTYADLKEERQKVMHALMQMDCIPAGMELFPAADEEQLQFIKRIIDDCDYYLLIIGGRYGSITAQGISYTEQEYEYALERKIKVIAFLHKNPEQISFDKSEKAPELREKLENFRSKVATGRLVKYWQNIEELPGLVALSLTSTIKSFPAIGWIRADKVSNEELLTEINELRKENEQLQKALSEVELKSEVKSNMLTVIDAIKTSKPHPLGATQEYFDLFSTNLEKFRIAQSQGDNEWDEKVIEVIEKFKPYRDEAIEVFTVIARYSKEESFGDELHRFFELLIPYMYKSSMVRQWSQWDWDYYKFIIHELFLYCAAVLLKSERFDMVNQLVRPYLVIDPLGNRNKIKSFSLFREYLKILEHRKKRLSSNRVSLHSDLLKERSSKNVNFDLLMQADFLLFIIDVMQLSKEMKNFDDLKWNQGWFPQTLLYKADYFESNSPFDIFLKAESKQYFDKLKVAIGVNAKSELLPMIDAFENGKLHTPNWGYGHAISPKFLINFDNLCTRD